MKRLLDFLNVLALHEKYVEELDEIMAPVLNGKIPFYENMG